MGRSSLSLLPGNKSHRLPLDGAILPGPLRGLCICTLLHGLQQPNAALARWMVCKCHLFWPPCLPAPFMLLSIFMLCPVPIGPCTACAMCHAPQQHVDSRQGAGTCAHASYYIAHVFLYLCMHGQTTCTVMCECVLHYPMPASCCCVVPNNAVYFLHFHDRAEKP